MKTIFIIDDDLGFVFWLGQALADAGYQALPAKGFSEANALLSELNVEIDLWIVNPALGGAADFVNVLQRSRPNAKILAVLNDNDEQAGQIPNADITARKPVQADAAAATLWLRMVEQVLEGEGDADRQGNKGRAS